jgi:transcriptional antiterminator RfaH
MEKEISNSDRAWYCLYTQPKREHIAAANIKSRTLEEVYCPRISFHKRTRQGKKRFTEALFPGYIFVNWPHHQGFRHLMAMPGVRNIVRAGEDYRPVPSVIIEALRVRLGGDYLDLPEPSLELGQDVVIIDGPFAEFTAKVCLLPDGRDRVAVLLDFLGREITINVSRNSIMCSENKASDLMMPTT